MFLLTLISHAVQSLTYMHAHNECLMNQEELSRIAKITGDEITDSEDVKKRVPNAQVFKKAQRTFSAPRRVLWDMKKLPCVKAPPMLAAYNTLIERE